MNQFETIDEKCGLAREQKLRNRLTTLSQKNALSNREARDHLKTRM
jgi:hypothetical protein